METKTTNVETVNLSMASCIKAVTQSFTMGRKALHLELSVCLAILGSYSRAKEKLVGVYQKSGYDCENPNSRHYKTVNRRINAATALFEKVGQKKIEEWIGDLTDTKLIEAVGKGLDQYEFDSMDAVLEFVGKGSNRTRTTKPKVDEKGEKGEGTAIKTKEKEAVPVMKFNVGKLHIELPESATSQDMVKLAAKILDAARKKEQLELKAGVLVVKPEVGVSALH
jgi:hypothetical protein